MHARLKVLEAYKRALTTWGRWVDKNIDVNRTQLFFRGYSVTHFRYRTIFPGRCLPFIKLLGSLFRFSSYHKNIREIYGGMLEGRFFFSLFLVICHKDQLTKFLKPFDLSVVEGNGTQVDSATKK